MPNPYFQFKQYKIYHDQCAMKITQDASIFGALIESENAQRLLDIGSGSGILSIMQAQKSNAEITCIDIEAGAIAQTQFNIANAPFDNTFHIVHQDLNDWADHNHKRFDLIITNPPYYSDQDKGAKKDYNLARHNNEGLSFENLANSVEKLLSKEGSFWFILPIYESPKLLNALKKVMLFANKVIEVRHNINSENARHIIQCSRNEKEVDKSRLIVRELDNSYTQDFESALKDYYIKF